MDVALAVGGATVLVSYALNWHPIKKAAKPYSGRPYLFLIFALGAAFAAFGYLYLLYQIHVDDIDESRLLAVGIGFFLGGAVAWPWMLLLQPSPAFPALEDVAVLLTAVGSACVVVAAIRDEYGTTGYVAAAALAWQHAVHDLFLWPLVRSLPLRQ